jgi:arsenate reductase-like glutaredoxin family protein
VLEKTKSRVAAERLSKKQPLSDADATALLASVSEVVVAKGKAVRTLPAKEASLDDLRGPTGNFRAPMVRLGKRLLVGFHEETLRDALARASR